LARDPRFAARDPRFARAPDQLVALNRRAMAAAIDPGEERMAANFFSSHRRTPHSIRHSMAAGFLSRLPPHKERREPVP
jgi:hypothetical protein